MAVSAASFGGIWPAEEWWTRGRFIVSTDDAYVGAKNATISAKISGYIASINFQDNSSVKSRNVLIRIEDGDYRLAVQTARDNVATQQAVIERLEKQSLVLHAALDQAKAQLESAQAGAAWGESEFQRQKELSDHKFASEQKFEQARAARGQANAEVRRAQASVAAAEANIHVLKAQQEEARRTLTQFETALAKAERDLSFTLIRAPFDGVIGNRDLQVGDYVQPGQRLASLVPLDAVYIDANFKETQIPGLRPGQPVSISADALPEHKIVGTVESIAPASGSVFSLLPPDNATGNFTKIMQRIPVRITISAAAGQPVLRPGMSVYVSVDTRPEPVREPIVTANAGDPQ